MADWHPLAQALNRTMTAHAPGWTDHNDHDPGVTVLEVIAYLVEALQSQLTPEDRQRLVSRIISAMDDEGESSIVYVNGERWKRVRSLDELLRSAVLCSAPLDTGWREACQRLR